MKIVHVINYFSTKMKYQEYFLAKEQVTAGHEVYVITSNKIFPFPDYNNSAKRMYGNRNLETGYFVDEGIKIYRLNCLFEINARVYLKGMNALIKEIEPDLIISHGIVQFYTLDLLRCNFKSCRLVVDEHMLYTDISNSSIKKIFYLIYSFLFGKLIIKKFDKIIPISYGTIELINKIMKLKSKKIQMIPLGVDTTLFYPDKNKKNEFRSKYLIGNEQLVVTYTGKITEYKKVHAIINALNSIIDRSIVIVLVGNIDTIYFSYIQNIIKSSLHRVIHIDAVSHNYLPFIYNASDIAVWPAHQTISTLEASACSIPIICSNFLKERYEKGMGLGISDSNEDLRSKLSDLVYDKKKRIKMGVNGYENTNKYFSWKYINEKFLNV